MTNAETLEVEDADELATPTNVDPVTYVCEELVIDAEIESSS